MFEKIKARLTGKADLAIVHEETPQVGPGLEQLPAGESVSDVAELLAEILHNDGMANLYNGAAIEAAKASNYTETDDYDDNMMMASVHDRERTALTKKLNRELTKRAFLAGALRDDDIAQYNIPPQTGDVKSNG